MYDEEEAAATIDELNAAHDAQNSALRRKQSRMIEYRKLVKRLCGQLRDTRIELDVCGSAFKWITENTIIKVDPVTIEELRALLPPYTELVALRAENAALHAELQKREFEHVGH